MDGYEAGAANGLQDLSATFRTVRNDRIRQMAQLIAEMGAIPLEFLITRLELSQDVASKRLEALRRAGLVVGGRRDRGELTCRLQPSGWASASEWFAQLIGPLPEPEPGPSLNQLFLLLAEPKRRRLLEELGRRRPTAVGVLATAVGLQPYAASRKLAELQRSGCLRTEAVGRHVRCELRPAALTPAWDWVHQIDELARSTA